VLIPVLTPLASRFVNSQPGHYIRAMHLDLSDDEAAALTQELRERPLPFLTPHPHPERHPSQAPTGAGSRALAAAEGVCAAASDRGRTAPDWPAALKSEPHRSGTLPQPMAV
jgi:hypothetical protein